MNYILNTKAKKIEIFWDNANEYQGLINFLAQYPITEEKEIISIQSPYRTNIPNTITWENNGYSTSTKTIDSTSIGNSITICDDYLSGTIRADNSASIIDSAS